MQRHREAATRCVKTWTGAIFSIHELVSNPRLAFCFVEMMYVSAFHMRWMSGVLVMNHRASADPCALKNGTFVLGVLLKILSPHSFHFKDQKNWTFHSYFREWAASVRRILKYAMWSPRIVRGENLVGEVGCENEWYFGINEWYLWHFHLTSIYSHVSHHLLIVLLNLALSRAVLLHYN